MSAAGTALATRTAGAAGTTAFPGAAITAPSASLSRATVAAGPAILARTAIPPARSGGDLQETCFAWCYMLIGIAREVE